jgi:hypothetical protein
VVCAVGISLTIALSGIPMLVVADAALILVIVLSTSLIALPYGRAHLFSPPTLVLPYLVLSLGIRGFTTISSSQSELSSAVDMTSFATAGTVTYALTLGTIATLAYLTAFYVSTGDPLRKLPLAPSGLNLRPRGVMLLLAVTVCISAPAYLVLMARLGMDAILRPGAVAVQSTKGLFWAFPLLWAPILGALLAAGDRWAAGRPAGLLPVFTFLVSILAAFFLTSSKAFLFGGALIWLIMRHHMYRRTSLLIVLMVPVLGTFALPLLYAYRAFGMLGISMFARNANLLGNGFELLLGRSYSADAFIATILYSPTPFPYELGRPWLEIFYFWIPRVFWPTKPLSQSLEFGQTFLSSSAQAGQSYFSVSLLGDGYLNLGALGSILVFLILGVLSGVLYDRCVLRKSSAGTVLLFCSCAYPLAVSTEQSLSVFLTLFLPQLFIGSCVYLCYRWISRFEVLTSLERRGK